MSTPKSGTVVIGTKPEWVLYAESAKKKANRSDELRAKGCFTFGEFMQVSGMAKRQALETLERDGLKFEVCLDNKTKRTTRFYFPPSLSK